MTRQDDRQATARTLPGGRPDTTPEGLTVAAVANQLGVTPDAVRRRLHRGTLTGAKTEDGEWRVWLPDPPPETAPGDRPDAARTPPGQAPTEVRGLYESFLVAKDEEIAFLRTELTARTEELRRKDHLIAGFIERLPELPAGDDAPVAAQNRPGTTEPDRPASDVLMLRWRRWWRRMLEGP